MTRRILRFLVLGAILFAAARARAPEPELAPIDGPIVIDEAAVVDRWRGATGNAPDEATRRTLLAAAIDEEILVREALRAGLDRTDGVVWRRLVDNLRFVSEASAGNERALEREARRLGMERSDAVVRRRLVERMTEMLRARGGEPTESEIATWMAARGDTLREPDRLRLEHAFFSRARRGEHALDDARAAGSPPADGDPFLHGRSFAAVTARELERTFGPAFAAAALRAIPGEWTGPVESPYGVHRIRVAERIPGRATDGRPRAIAELRRARGDAALRDALVLLRARYGLDSPGAARR